MEASAQMHWGVICSIQDPAQVPEYIEFGNWLVKQLEESAAKLNLGHRFAEEATFALYAEPGSRDQSEKVYKMVAKDYPQASYVIHILPAKDSIEYEVLKEMTLQGALIGQGVLAANALNHFEAYKLNEVLDNMNQWIGRRLAQITARRTAEAKKTVMGLGPIKELFQFPNQTQVPPAQNKPPYVQIKEPTQIKIKPLPPQYQQNYPDRRTDKYQMVVTSQPTADGTIGRGGGTATFGRGGRGRFNPPGSGAMPSQSAPANVRKPFFGSSAGSGNYTGGFGRPQMQLPPPPLYGARTDDFEHPVSIALHSYGNRSNYSSNQSNYRNPPPSPYTSSFGAPPPTVRPPSAAGSDHSSGNQGKKQQHPMEGTEREKEIIISGYPQNFNKFQIASLFSDFRPLNVQYIATGESIVQFANKYHAAQVIEKYNGRSYPDEGFCLKVQTAAQESPSKQIEHAKAKMSRLLLQKAVKETAAVGSNNNDDQKEQPGKNEAKKPETEGQVKEELAKEPETATGNDTPKEQPGENETKKADEKEKDGLVKEELVKSTEPGENGAKKPEEKESENGAKKPEEKESEDGDKKPDEKESENGDKKPDEKESENGDKKPDEKESENGDKKPEEKEKEVKEKVAKSTEKKISAGDTTKKIKEGRKAFTATRKISTGDAKKKPKRILSISADTNQNEPVEQKELSKSTEDIKASAGDTTKTTKRRLSIATDPNQNTKPVEMEQQADEAVVAAAEQLP